MRIREVITESADEEAWELVGQPVSEIQAFVRQIGMANDRRSVAKIASAIEATPDTSLPATSIPRLKNLANKPGDPEILRALQKISGQPDAAEHYMDLMARRDAGEGRDRGYDVSNLITAVRDGQYESPVLLRLPTGVYVIGGRTRLYAALALNVPIKVKIIGPQTFAKQGMSEGQPNLVGKTLPTEPRGRGRPPGIKHPLDYIDNRDDGLPRIGRVEKTATGLKHHARPERGGVEPTADPLATLDKATTNRLDRAFGVKWPKEKKWQGGIDLPAVNSNQQDHAAQ